MSSDPTTEINYVDLLNQMSELPTLTQNIKTKQQEVTAKRTSLNKTIQDMLILVNGLQSEIKNIKGKGSEEVKKIKQAIKQAKESQDNTVTQAIAELGNIVDLQGLESNVNSLYGKIKGLRDSLNDSSGGPGTDAPGGVRTIPVREGMEGETGGLSDISAVNEQMGDVRRSDRLAANRGGYTYGSRKKRRRSRAKRKNTKRRKSIKKKYF